MTAATTAEDWDDTTDRTDAQLLARWAQANAHDPELVARGLDLEMRAVAAAARRAGQDGVDHVEG